MDKTKKQQITITIEERIIDFEVYTLIDIEKTYILIRDLYKTNKVK